MAFPSPCGDVVLKSDKYNRLHFMPKFPSPYGDVVLKSNLFSRMCSTSMGFRPLAGMWF